MEEGTATLNFEIQDASVEIGGSEQLDHVSC